MSASKLLVLSTLFLMRAGALAALSPVIQPPIPPGVRLTIGLNRTGILGVYRNLEQVAVQAKFTCVPTTKTYESWRANGFEPNRRDMVCNDSDNNVVDASWLSMSPESITIDVRKTSKDEESKARVDRLIGTLEKSLNADQLVMTLVKESWSPEHTRSTIKSVCQENQFD
jgi:hypothetical protein